VNYLSNNVAIVPTRRVVFPDVNDPRKQGEMPEVLQFVAVGHGPNGIALSDDQKTAYVYNSFDHSVSVLESDGKQVVVRREIKDITPQTLSEAEQRGRRFFHDASSPLITRPETGGVACASCHPGGREDGRTWHFAEGLRNTPTLVGKNLRSTAPYHWDGAFTDFNGLQHVLRNRMGGEGLSERDFGDILTYLDGQPAPDNPFRSLDGSLTDEQQLGKALYNGKAACIACHSGENTTDNLAWDVGTNFSTIPIAQLEAYPVVTGQERVSAAPNTPSLKSVFASAPYLHDGSIATLEARVRTNPGGAHGSTSDLSETEVRALVAYLKTL
jgi:mono/diheme cytochrome c family protein